MIEQGQYEEAESLLEEIAGEEFADMDISELLLYCEAYGYYESGDIAAAYQKLETLKLENVSEELKDGLEDFQKQITAEYEVYQAEKEAEEEAAYEEKIKNGVTYFTARCVQGKVIQVWDNRDLLDASDNSSSEKKSSFSGSGGRVISGDSSSGNKADNESEENGSEDDPYHVYDYDDPEEFYYDYYDDFDEYEDAETYWYNAWR